MKNKNATVTDLKRMNKIIRKAKKEQRNQGSITRQSTTSSVERETIRHVVHMMKDTVSRGEVERYMWVDTKKMRCIVKRIGSNRVNQGSAQERSFKQPEGGVWT